MSNIIDWEYSSNLSLMSISSYVVQGTKETVQGTKETGNIYMSRNVPERLRDVLIWFYMISIDSNDNM